MKLWNSRDADLATGGSSSVPWSATGLAIDSRNIAAGNLFFALDGQRDGHDFVIDAFRRGASAAVVARQPSGLPGSAALLKVQDVLKALTDLAAMARLRSRARVVAITGSAGKTSSKDMLAKALRALGMTHMATESFNNHIGVPLTLAETPPNAAYSVVEIGMNHPGEIAPLAELAQPDVAILTTVAPAHLAAFRSVEAIAEEKASIFSGLAPGGTAVINADALGIEFAIAQADKSGARKLFFGRSSLAQYRLIDASISSGGTIARIDICGRQHTLRLAARGTHFAMNAAAILAAVDAVDGDSEAAIAELRDWEPPPGRGNRYQVAASADAPEIDLVDDSYNANPASLAAALESIAAIQISSSGRRIAVLGDMLELGESAAELHASIARHPAMAAITKVFCAGHLMKHLHEALPKQCRAGWCETAEELSAVVRDGVRPGDLVLIKGSKGSRISLIAEELRQLGCDTG